MSELIDFFRVLNDGYWRSSLFQGMFYLSLLIILTVEKKQEKRILYGGYPLVLLVVIFNPITVKLTRRFFSESSLLAYYMRWFSFLPMMCLMAMSVTHLANRTSGMKKLLLVLCAALFIVVGGHNVYALDWMRPATNAAKVPDDAQQICALLHDDDKDIMVAVPNAISGYIRQLDASFYTPYGRYGEWDDLLMSEAPDAEAILVRARQQGCDYVAVDKSEAMKTAFNERGLQETGETISYLVYPVTGVQGIRKTYNEERQVASITYVDDQDIPVVCTNGYATACYDYNWNGKITYEYYLDDMRNPTNCIYGYNGVLREYDSKNRCIQCVYVNEAKQPVMSSLGYAELLYEYDDKGKIDKLLYMDADGEPACQRDGNYGASKAYDDKGRLIRLTLLDMDGNPCDGKNGYAAICYGYDDAGNIIQEAYLDTGGNPTERSGGFYKVIKSYDAAGRVSRVSYYGKRDNPVIASAGYASASFEYDSEGRVFQEFYYGEDGTPCAQALGNCGVQKEYDDEGNLWKFTYLAADSTPYVIADGYATLVTERYDQGKTVWEYYLGVDGVPSKYRDMWFGVRREYQNGNVVKLSYLDESGQTQVISQGYAIVTYAYDVDNHITECRQYDADGMPVMCVYGYHGIFYTYDDRGYCIEAEYIDLNDKVVTISNGIARIFYERDEHGNNTLEWYEDEYGDSVSINGYYKIRRVYDENNAVIETIYLDENGNPVDTN